MEPKYSRNNLSMTPDNLAVIKRTRLLIGGSNLGMTIAKQALQNGFENITIVDGIETADEPENEQFREELLSPEQVKEHIAQLQEVNPEAMLTWHRGTMEASLFSEVLAGQSLAVNAFDDASNVPMQFDRDCNDAGIPVIHPYNLGWGSLVVVVSPESLSLETIVKDGELLNASKVVEYVTSYMKFWGKPQDWIEEAAREYRAGTDISKAQLLRASQLVAKISTHIAIDIATGNNVKQFPEFYLTKLEEDLH